MPDTGMGFPQLAGGSVVTVGTFDGVHLGHRDILRVVHERARATGFQPVLITFRPHPLEVVNPLAAPMMLTPEGEQLDALADSGQLFVVVLPFTRELASYEAQAFVSELLVNRYRVRELIIGHDHGLGRGRGGDAAMLAALGREQKFDLQVVPAMLDRAGVPISSSAVRNSIAHGDLVRARYALGRHYGFRGAVVPGSQRGRAIGFPTLNLALSSRRKLLPPDGVYAVCARSRRGTFGGMLNLGGRPTFGELERVIEAHLFDVSGDWYGELVYVELIQRLRDTVRFSGVDALVAQLKRDADAARVALTQD